MMAGENDSSADVHGIFGDRKMAAKINHWT